MLGPSEVEALLQTAHEFEGSGVEILTVRNDELCLRPVLVLQTRITGENDTTYVIVDVRSISYFVASSMVGVLSNYVDYYLQQYEQQIVAEFFSEI